MDDAKIIGNLNQLRADNMSLAAKIATLEKLISGGLVGSPVERVLAQVGGRPELYIQLATGTLAANTTAINLSTISIDQGAPYVVGRALAFSMITAAAGTYKNVMGPIGTAFMRHAAANNTAGFADLLDHPAGVSGRFEIVTHQRRWQSAKLPLNLFDQNGRWEPMLPFVWNGGEVVTITVTPDRAPDEAIDVFMLFEGWSCRGGKNPQ